MEQLIQDFNVHLKTKKHLLEMFQEIPSLSILKGNDGQTVVMEMNFTNEFESIGKGILLKGKADSFRDLLCGKRKLRMLAETGEIQIVCPFRDLLKLETIFYLVQMEMQVYSKN